MARSRSRSPHHASAASKKKRSEKEVDVAKKPSIPPTDREKKRARLVERIFPEEDVELGIALQRFIWSIDWLIDWLIDLNAILFRDGFLNLWRFFCLVVCSLFSLSWRAFQWFAGRIRLVATRTQKQHYNGSKIVDESPRRYRLRRVLQIGTLPDGPTVIVLKNGPAIVGDPLGSRVMPKIFRNLWIWRSSVGCKSSINQSIDQSTPINPIS